MNNNEGILWDSKTKESKTDPDFTGFCKGHDGTEYWVYAHKRTDDDKTRPAITFTLRPNL